MEDNASELRLHAPQAVVALIERFARNQDAYRSNEYNEYQLRSEFLDPFFKALGWDVYNESDHAEAYKDVVHRQTDQSTGLQALWPGRKSKEATK